MEDAVQPYCDRCGKTIRRGVAHLLQEGYRTYYAGERNSNIEDEIRLCPRCRRKFDSWLKSGYFG